MNAFNLLFISAVLTSSLAAQHPEHQDKVVFEVEKDAKFDAIKAELRKAQAEPDKKAMWVDFARIDAPKSISEFSQVWHQPPVCQGVSGMCWCFSTTSFLESEAYRQTKRQLHFSVMHSVYWEYVEKARGFVQSRGKSTLGEGSQGAAVLRAWRTHGVVPADAYTGLKDGLKDYDHAPLFKEIKAFLEGVKSSGAWNEAQVVATVRAILDHHLGAPPTTVTVDGKQLTPLEYLQQVARLNPDDYVEFVSFLSKPYWAHTEYEVPDNWWHGREYINLPLDAFLAAFKGSLGKGYSTAIAADMSEPGYAIGAPGIAVVPTWDIPSDYIDEAARQFRFNNGTTTDDHGLHVVGTARKNGQDWYLVKDSWSSAWNNDHPGYYFFREDYLKLKMLGFMVHKDAVKDLLTKVKD